MKVMVLQRSAVLHGPLKFFSHFYASISFYCSLFDNCKKYGYVLSNAYAALNPKQTTFSIQCKGYD